MDKPSIFISYSRKDMEFVRRLAGDLERAGYAPWWDVKGLRGGQQWVDELEKQVRACDAFVVVVSPASRRSKWVKINLALTLTNADTGAPDSAMLSPMRLWTVQSHSLWMPSESCATSASGVQCGWSDLMCSVAAPTGPPSQRTASPGVFRDHFVLMKAFTRQ